jgi:hypothetical protein
VISFKCGPGTGVLSCPLADMSSMDSLSLLRFFKDKNSVLKKIIAVAPEKVGKNQWHEVKPIFRPDSLTFAVAELKEIKEMRNKLKKKGKAVFFYSISFISLFIFFIRFLSFLSL